MYHNQRTRLAIYYDANLSNPMAGGGHTYQISILNAIKEVDDGQIEPLIFTRGRQSIAKDTQIGCVDISLYRDINLALREKAIHILWSLSPLLPIVNVPFIMPVWDLQHRSQPYFPEVSVSGWDWDSREEHYARLLPRATFILTGTETGKKEVSFFYRIPIERIAVIPFPVPEIDMTLAQGGDELLNACPYKETLLSIKGKFLFYPAQFWPHKNHILILEAISKLRQFKDISIPVVFTGSDHGNLEYIRSQAEGLGVLDLVTFAGFVDTATLYWLYKNSLLMVFPTFFGPDNIPPLEAFQLGCPVAVSDVPGAKEQLGDAVMYFDPKDEDPLIEALLSVIDNPALRQNLIEKGLERVRGLSGGAYVQRVYAIVKDFMKIRRTWGDEFLYYGSAEHIQMMVEEGKLLKALKVASDTNNLPLQRQIREALEEVDRVLKDAERFCINGQYNEAETLLLNILKVCKDNPIVYNNLAIIEWQKGNLTKAEEYFVGALSLAPESVEVKENYRSFKAHTGTVKS